MTKSKQIQEILKKLEESVDKDSAILVSEASGKILCIVSNLEFKIDWIPKIIDTIIKTNDTDFTSLIAHAITEHVFKENDNN